MRLCIVCLSTSSICVWDQLLCFGFGLLGSACYLVHICYCLAYDDVLWLGFSVLFVASLHAYETSRSGVHVCLGYVCVIRCHVVRVLSGDHHTLPCAEAKSRAH